MKILHDKGNHTFYLADTDGERIAEMTYIIKNSIMDINKTYVEEHLRETQIARYLVDMGVSYARREGYKIDASCSYANKVVQQYYPDLAAHPVLTV